MKLKNNRGKSSKPRAAFLITQRYLGFQKPLKNQIRNHRKDLIFVCIWMLAHACLTCFLKIMERSCVPLKRRNQQSHLKSHIFTQVFIHSGVCSPLLIKSAEPLVRTSCFLYSSKPYLASPFLKCYFEKQFIYSFIQHNYEVLQFAKDGRTFSGTCLLIRHTRSLPTERSLM